MITLLLCDLFNKNITIKFENGELNWDILLIGKKERVRGTKYVTLLLCDYIVFFFFTKL